MESSGEPRPESIRAGQAHRIQSPDALALEFTGWGRVVIRSGAGELRNAAETLAREENQLHTDLACPRKRGRFKS